MTASTDVFHSLRDLGTLRRKLENSAYRAFAAEYKAAQRAEKADTSEAQEKLHHAKAESRRQAELYDAFAEHAGWVHESD